MDEKPRIAHIYSRVSKGTQVKGDGLRRQIEIASKFIEDVNISNSRDGLPVYTLADSPIYDRGLSAYFGLNTDENAGLGAFLKAAENGQVEKGTLLIVEAIDRISRLPVDDARALFARFKKYGIDVAICRFNLIIYHDKSSDLGQDLLITTAIHLAHLESEQKSKRIRARFTHKRLLEKEGGERRTSMSPSWIELSKDKTHFVLIPERARIVRKMVDLKLQGWGAHRITVYLNEEGYPCWNRSKAWYTKIVEKYLKMIQLVGDFQPVEHVHGEKGVRKEPVGDVIKGYYPALITEEEWIRLKASFKRSGGRQTGAFSNLFSNMLYCPTCGSCMSYFKPNRGRIKVRCRKQIDKQGCDQRALNYEEIEPRLIKALAGLDYAKINNNSFASLQKELNTLEAQVTELEASADAIKTQMLEESDPRIIPVYVNKLKAIYTEQDKAKTRFEKLSTQTSDYDVNTLEQLQLERNEDRERYNGFVRSFVKYVIASDSKLGKPLRIVFKSEAVGEVPVFFNDDKNNKAISDIFTAQKDVNEAAPIRLINMSRVHGNLGKLAAIDTVPVPDDLGDTLTRIKYLFAVKQAVLQNPEKWQAIADDARLFE